MMPLFVLFTFSVTRADAPTPDALRKAAGLLAALKPLPVADLQVNPLSAPSRFADSAWVYRSVYNDFPNGKKYHEWVCVFFKDGRYVQLRNIFGYDDYSEDRVAAYSLREQGRWKEGLNGIVNVNEWVSDGKPVQRATSFKIHGNTLVEGNTEITSEYNKKRLNAKLTIEAMKKANDAKW